ncbi:Alpha/beta hydrolase fold-1 [Aspergillus pseudotamarii]|uniref:Alpha/beta hydrolase fold-1 n=1 Tax=Aspergillus pseudotamarii TaxID=132259 RepID=A0A5N6T2Q1_ASPPS|nr:Alpha/beta hydrolase fold-1 [Aspergillus pseudotamarii]KAE8140481.1 Alpha/beta hydrolase fold-1 [Aspergillus pseudotamarii]
MSTAPRPPTFLIIHGSWHYPELYGTFCKAVENRGTEVVCPRLPSCSGELLPTKTIEDDVALVRDIAQSLVQEGKEVFAVMHSYGGMVGTDALAGLGIQRLIYLAAFVPFSGNSLVDMFGGSLAPFIVCDEQGMLRVPDAASVFYQDLPDDEATFWAERLVPQPKSAQVNPITHEAYRNIPATYIVCEDDQAIPVSIQEKMILDVQNAGVSLDVIRIPASHSPFLSTPDSTAEIVVNLAAK